MFLQAVDIANIASFNIGWAMNRKNHPAKVQVLVQSLYG